MEAIDGDFVYECNVCNEGLDTEDEMKEHLNKNHKEMILNIKTVVEKDHLKLAQNKQHFINHILIQKNQRLKSSTLARPVH